MCDALWSIFCHPPPVLISYLWVQAAPTTEPYLSVHKSLITHPPPRSSSILSARNIVAGQEKYLPPSLRWGISLSWTPCTPGSSKPLLTLEINPAVCQRTIHLGQLRGSLVYTFPWCPRLLCCRLIAGFIKWAGSTVLHQVTDDKAPNSYMYGRFPD